MVSKMIAASLSSRRFLYILSFVFFSSCNLLETKEYRYKDVADAQESVARGWIPRQLLPPSANTIWLRYDLDSNNVLLAFRFSQEDFKDLLEQCPQTDARPAESMGRQIPWLQRRRYPNPKGFTVHGCSMGGRLDISLGKMWAVYYR